MHTDQGGGDRKEGDTSMLLQPETKPITQEQLVNEVKGIYAGLVVSLALHSLSQPSRCRSPSHRPHSYYPSCCLMH